MPNEHQNLSKRERRELKRQERQQEKLHQQKQAEQRRLLKRAALWLFVALGIGGIVFGMVKFVNNSSPEQAHLPTDAISDYGWAKGSKAAKVTLVEYSDFQCPACRSNYLWIQKLTQEFNDSIQFVYRHFPLKQIHIHAELAARAAEAAGKQGKFWEMHDMLFENQHKWSNYYTAEDTFIKYAQALHLNIDQFVQDLHSKEVRERVESDFQDGLQLGVNATPTFFLNGRKIENPRSYEAFRNILNEAIRDSS